MTKRWLLPFSLLLVAAFFGCSSSSDDGTSNEPGPGEEQRRVAIGKADELSGKCLDNGTSYCGGKSKSAGAKCYCDASCKQYGDCCSDYKDNCTGCDSSADCKQGEYCKAEPGCNTPGKCEKIPLTVLCTANIQPYCGCDGKTHYSNSGCVWDRYEKLGPCDSQNQQCGGIAGLPCPTGETCIDDPSDSCDPNNGGADCGGICIKKTQCGGLAGIPCPPGFKCSAPPPGCFDCPGTCVPACNPVVCTLFCENGMKTDANGCQICACNDPAPSDSCEGICGSPSADKSCYCDKSCKQYGDCCADYDAQCGTTRTPASGQCVKNSNDACTTDADCFKGGCGGELCYNPAGGGGFSTCECAGPGAPVTGCGCVAGKCTWYN